MRLLSGLFGKKVTIIGHDKNGKPFEREVSERQLKGWEAKGKLSKVEAVEVHVLDPKGDYSTQWLVGKDISPELLEKFRDSASGALYAITIYKAGVPETMLAAKEKWLEVKSTLQG
ncbi:MAG TPA: hypothetical protein VGO35_06545 [Gammaproteobacteria bacterium]|jgi:hypothetical protein|nr:hypothetical protein [Gammaproteobacteria bacterium]